ncbi:transglycosylase domain-containing protein [Peribacillus loiseleuriae]|uniref:transglycosylase domain-containing protein n=1 Tax=Peribacillus loiseleuriae TaxID=1679170 RepID=UPI003CFF2333
MKGFFTKIFNKNKLSYFFHIGLISFSAVLLIAVVFLTFYKPDISLLTTELKRSTEIYDVDGELASKITANKTEGASIDDIPNHVKNAVVAIEDHRFYEHNGIDYKGIFRAVYVNMKAGKVVEGGSTITQQLIKIALLEQNRTFKRKLEEFFIAREVEKEYSKDEVLGMYLNQIYFGHGAWGIKKAARIYFGKDVNELTLSEGAMLAGVINIPTKLDPYNHYDAALKRRNLVLTRMATNGFIDSEQAEQAKSEEIILAHNQKEDQLKGKYPYFVDVVLTEASKKYNLEIDELLRGGYKIYTTLDQHIQQALEEVYENNENFPKGVTDALVQSGMVLINPKTGGINALIGGRGKHQFLGYNRATQLKASPGSTIKPLAVYTPALEEGYKLTDLLVDEKMNFGGYEPSNANGQYLGEVPLYEALMKSLNVPTVWLMNEIGIEKSIRSLERFGIPLTENDRNLSLALGGMEKGVSPQDMAEAYSAFANNGERVESHTIVKIENAQGQEVAVWKEKSTKIMEKKVADQMNRLLLGVVEYGTGKNAAVEGYEIAGKTGSVQVTIPGIKSGVKDQWFVGYTPSLVGAVWAGYDRSDKTHYLTTNSSQGTALIFQKVMTNVLLNQEAESFHVASLEPLIEERKKELEKKEQKQYWRDKGSELQDSWKKWWNKLLKKE